MIRVVNHRSAQREKRKRPFGTYLAGLPHRTEDVVSELLQFHNRAIPVY